MNLWHLGLCLIAASAVAGAGQVEWKHLSSKTGDLPAPGNSTQQTASLILDVDKDGVNDFVIAARQKAPSLVWFRRTKTGWTRYVIDKDLLPLEAGGTFADIDGDGDGKGNFTPRSSPSAFAATNPRSATSTATAASTSWGSPTRSILRGSMCGSTCPEHSCFLFFRALRLRSGQALSRVSQAVSSLARPYAPASLLAPALALDATALAAYHLRRGGNPPSDSETPKPLRTAPRAFAEGGEHTGGPTPMACNGQGKPFDASALSRETILRALESLSEGLGRAGVTGEICICGGTVMVLAFAARPSTKDVDAIFQPIHLIRDLARGIAEQESLPESWLNDAVKGFVSARHETTTGNLPQFPHLRLTMPVPEYLLAMKCMAARIGGTAGEPTDVSDIVFLIRRLRLKSASQVLDLVAQYYPANRIPVRTRYLIEGLFDEGKI